MMLCEHQGYSRDCEIEAGRKICYPCGMPVCAGCSHMMIRLRDGRRIRVGIPCIDDHEGEYVLTKPMKREQVIGENYLRKHGHDTLSFSRLLRHYGFSAKRISGGVHQGEIQSNAPIEAVQTILEAY